MAMHLQHLLWAASLIVPLSGAISSPSSGPPTVLSSSRLPISTGYVSSSGNLPPLSSSQSNNRTASFIAPTSATLLPSQSNSATASVANSTSVTLLSSQSFGGTASVATTSSGTLLSSSSQSKNGTLSVAATTGGTLLSSQSTNGTASFIATSSDTLLPSLSNNGNASVIATESATLLSTQSNSGNLLSSQSNNGTASVVATTSGTLLPGSTVKAISASTTSSIVLSSANPGSLPTLTNTDVPATTAAGAIPILSITLSGSAASSQESQFGGIIGDFVNGGRSWAKDITLAAVKTQAVQEVENMLDNTENMIKDLGGDFPPTTNACSNAGKRKRFFNPLSVVKSLANDALGLANCIDNILNDISNEIGPLTGPPPPSDVIPEINTQLDALEQAGEEEEDQKTSTTDTESSTASSTDSSASPSSGSSTLSSISSSRSSVPSSVSSSVSSTLSSSLSSASGACPTYSYPSGDITEWEGVPDDSDSSSNSTEAQKRFVARAAATGTPKAPPGTYTAVNSCNFPNSLLAVQPKFSSLKKLTNFGKFPNQNGGTNGQVYNNVAKWYVGNHTCGSSPGFRWYRTTDQSPTGIPAGSKQSVEHVYEKQLIILFLRSQIDIASFTCDDMNTLFFPSCDKKTAPQNKMQTLFDQLPGMQFDSPININDGFAGLELSLNQVKGYMFDEGISPPKSNFAKSRLQDTQSKINTIQDFIMLFGVIKDSAFQKMYDVTNNRVYQAFSGFDDLISTAKLEKADGTPMIANWAANYKTWMTNYLADIAPPAWTWASTTRDDLETQLNADTTTDPAIKAAQLKMLADIKTAPGFSESAFTCDFGLTWATGVIAVRDFRNLKRDGTCSLLQSQLSSATTNPTATALSASSSTAASSTPTIIATTSGSPPTTITTSYRTTTPATPPTTSSQQPDTSPTNVCIGNQIQGSCVEAPLPSEAPYSGVQPPVCYKVDSTTDDYRRVNATQANQAAADYCNSLAENKVILTAQSGSANPYHLPNAAENGGQLVLNVLFDVGACPEDKSQTTLDFTKLSAQECQSDFYLSISEFCAQDSSWGSAYDPDYTIEGGLLLNDCGLFSLSGLPAAST